MKTRYRTQLFRELRDEVARVAAHRPGTVETVRQQVATEQHRLRALTLYETPQRPVVVHPPVKIRHEHPRRHALECTAAETCRQACDHVCISEVPWDSWTACWPT